MEFQLPPSREGSISEIPSRVSRWSFNFTLNRVDGNERFAITFSLKLKLHRLKPDGIWGRKPFVRLKLKLHRLKPDGILDSYKFRKLKPLRRAPSSAVDRRAQVFAPVYYQLCSVVVTLSGLPVPSSGSF
jgi:hypothetical protein